MNYLSYILVSIISLILSTTVFSNSSESDPKLPMSYQQLAHDLLKQIIEIPSTYEIGTKKVADALAERFKAAGFPSSDIHLIENKNNPNQANLVVHLHGTGKEKPILWIGHIDVVKAKPEDWSVPPFQLTEKDNYFYGRGTTDMKDGDVATAVSLIRLKEEGYIPNRDIIVAFTADEETGKDNGIAYLLKNHPDLINAALVINADGGSGEMANGKRLDFAIETSQKTYASFLLEITNKGGHSSEPRPDNAIDAMAYGLINLSQYQFPFVLNETTRLYFQRMAINEKGQMRSDMLAVAQQKPDLTAATRLAKNVYFNAILHTTCVPTIISGGYQENALPQRVTATVQCRIMPSETVEQTKLAIEKAISNPDISVKLIKVAEHSPESPLPPTLLSSVEKVVHSLWPGVIVTPQMIAGASDSAKTRNAGMPTYGIYGAWNDINDIRFHGKDERHEMNDFYSSIEFTYRLMKELSKS